MAESSNWSVYEFLNRLQSKLTDSYPKTEESNIGQKPDIDRQYSWNSWWGDGENYWNLSVKRLIESWNNRNEIVPEVGRGEVNKIKNADAGWRFTGEPYVNPDLNIDKDAYEKVRGEDKIEEVLQNSKQMQYTHSQEQVEGDAADQSKGKYSKDKYIRLLMPKYLRRVEVEDLNRNFWVIAQTIGLISDYLLNPNSLLNRLLEGMLKEIAQLWDNTHRIWEAILGLGKQIEKADDRINKIVESTQKTKVNINLNIYPEYKAKGKEIRRLLQLDPEDTTIKVEITDIDFYPISYKDGKWVYDKQDGTITMTPGLFEYDNNISRCAAAMNNSICLDTKTGVIKDYGYKDSGLKAYKTGCIISFKINGGEVKRVAYDLLNPYVFSDNNFYGVYQYMQIIDANQAYLHINKTIMDSLSQKSSGIYTHPTFNEEIGTTTQRIGPIEIERDGTNKKPVTEILSNIMGFNFVLRDLAVNSYSERKICSWDLIPGGNPLNSATVSKVSLRDSFLKLLNYYTTNANDSYRTLPVNAGENVSVIWTAPAAIYDVLGIEKEDPTVTYDYIRKNNQSLGMAFLEKLRADNVCKVDDSEYYTLIRQYQVLMANLSNTNYKSFLENFLRITKLLPEDLLGTGYTMDASIDTAWLKEYEDAVKAAVKDATTIAYRVFSVTSFSTAVSGTTIPWAFLEAAHYQKEMNIFASYTYLNKIKAVLDGYEGSSHGGNIHWALISSIVPEEAFMIGGGNVMVSGDSEGSRVLMKQAVKNYIGRASMAALKAGDVYIKNYLNNTNEKNATMQGVAAIGNLTAMAMKGDSEAAGIRTESIQPYLPKSLNNYWITFSSGATTGGRIQVRINYSNLRSFSCPNGLLGAMNGTQGQPDCFPHNTNLSLTYFNPFPQVADFGTAKMDEIIRFNSPENVNLGLKEPTKYLESASEKNWYGKFGFVDWNHCVVRHTENENFLVDGFLGAKSGVDWAATTSGGNRGFNFQAVNADKRGLTASAQFIEYYKPTTDLSESDQKTYGTYWRCQSPPLWRSNTAVYGKVRPIKLFTPYGMMSTSGGYRQFQDESVDELLRVSQSTSDAQKASFSVQLELLSYSTSGATTNNYCILSASKDEKEIIDQERIQQSMPQNEEWKFK